MQQTLGASFVMTINVFSRSRCWAAGVLGLCLALSSCVNQPEYRAIEDYWRYDDLYDFAYLICLSQTHRQENRVPIANELDKEAWRFVERGDFPGRTYVQVVSASRSFAHGIPSGDSAIACARWKRSETLRQVILISLY